jgi:HEPN domain-containing protein
MNRADFQQLSELRIKEARSLMDAGFPDGAYYLAGYAVECALKACIAKRTRQHDFPPKPNLVRDIYTHELEKLLTLAELKRELESAPIEIRSRWDFVQNWSEERRYQHVDEREARLLLNAIEDHSGGLLPWIRLHW